MNGPLRRAQRAVNARQIYSEPIEREGVTLVPAAFVMGGGGGGTGNDPETKREGEGGGFGLIGFPVGAYEIREEEVRWRPVLDLNKLLGAIVLLAALRAIVRALR
jgi:uncharacterized spore protein YtfJ